MIEEVANRRVLAIIPARSGSKRIKNKNVTLIAGKPLIAYAIEAAQKSKYIDKVMVTTDGKEIAAVAKKFKAEVPFMRPAKLASDKARSYDVVRHAVEFYEAQNDFYDIIVLVQPTTPLVEAKDIDEAILKLLNSRSNSCVSMCEISERPEWVFEIDGKRAVPASANFSEAKRSQDLPDLYRLNGAVYAARKELILKKNMLIDYQNLSAVIMERERSIDIDEPIDLEIAAAIIKKNKRND